MKIQHLIFVLIICMFLTSCQNNTKEDQGAGQEEASQVTDDTKTEDTKTEEKVIADKEPATGIDISKFQGDEIHYLKTHKEGLTFIICKATEGITYTDPMFEKNWASIYESGFIRGAYHFYRSNDDPDSQADNFLHKINDLKKSDIAPIVDFEGGGIDKSQSIEDIQSKFLVFLKRIESSSNRKPIIYTDITSGNKYLNNNKFAEYALWVALYSKVEEPRLPTAWKNKSWKFWQKTSKYMIDNKKDDFDVFNGNKEDLLKFIKTY